MSNEKKQNESKEQSFFIVPVELLNTISENNSKILSILTGNQPPQGKALGDYISEEEAKKLLNKKTTWFWNMRKSGELAFSKVGGTNYYSKADILKLIERSKRDGK